MSVLSKLKRNKTEFLIGQRLNKNERKQKRVTLVALENSLVDAEPENHRSFAKKVQAIRNLREQGFNSDFTPITPELSGGF